MASNRITAFFASIFASILAFFSGLFVRRSRTPPVDVEAKIIDASPDPSPQPTPHGSPKLLSAAEVFDSVGPAYEDAFHGLPTQAAAIDWLVGELAKTHPHGGARIVDVGCGTGRPACSVLADAGHDVLGIDISEAMLTAARERVPNARFELMDVRAFLERETNSAGTYDAVTIFFSLIAGVTQADIREILTGLARLLKPGGFMVFSTVPLPVENESIKWMGRPLVVSSLSPEDAVASISAAGLDIVYQGVTQFLPRASEAGICKPDEVWEEPHLFVYARKA